MVAGYRIQQEARDQKIKYKEAHASLNLEQAQPPSGTWEIARKSTMETSKGIARRFGLVAEKVKKIGAKEMLAIAVKDHIDPAKGLSLRRLHLRATQWSKFLNVVDFVMDNLVIVFVAPALVILTIW